MNTISRRRVLKDLGLLAAVAAVNRMGFADRMAEEPVRLAVFLHGMFLIDVRGSAVHAYTPDVTDHKYRIGRCGDPMADLKTGPYSLSGPQSSGPAAPNPDCNAILQASDFPNFEIYSLKARNAFAFPQPARLYSVRCYDSSGVIRDPSHKLKIGKKLALCQVLVYENVTYQDLKLSPTVSASWPPPIENGCAKLHIWAEPDTNPGPGHPGMAWDKMMQLLPPAARSQFVKDLNPPQPDSGVSGVINPEDEWGLAECGIWQKKGKPTKNGKKMLPEIFGSRPSNCQTLIVT